jgi:hypothetical protein
VIDAELDRTLDYGASAGGVAWWPEHAWAGELHRAEAHPIDRLCP